MRPSSTTRPADGMNNVSPERLQTTLGNGRRRSPTTHSTRSGSPRPGTVGSRGRRALLATAKRPARHRRARCGRDDHTVFPHRDVRSPGHRRALCLAPARCRDRRRCSGRDSARSGTTRRPQYDFERGNRDANRAYFEDQLRLPAQRRNAFGLVVSQKAEVMPSSGRETPAPSGGGGSVSDALRPRRCGGRYLYRPGHAGDRRRGARRRCAGRGGRAGTGCRERGSTSRSTRTSTVRRTRSACAWAGCGSSSAGRSPSRAAATSIATTSAPWPVTRPFRPVASGPARPRRARQAGRAGRGAGGRRRRIRRPTASSSPS